MSSPSPDTASGNLSDADIFHMLQVKFPIEFLPTSFCIPLHILSSMSKITSPPADVERETEQVSFPPLPCHRYLHLHI